MFGADGDQARNKGIADVFAALDWLEAHLGKERSFLCGESVSEADIRAFMTLYNFDHMYRTAFRCHTRRIRASYPNLHRHIPPPSPLSPSPTPVYHA